MGQMADRQRGRDTAVFVHDEGVRHACGGAGASELGQDELAAVDARTRREEQAEFLGEGEETGRRGAGGGQQGARVGEDGDGVCVFVVKVLVDFILLFAVDSVNCEGGWLGFVGFVISEEGLAVEGSARGGFGGA